MRILFVIFFCRVVMTFATGSNSIEFEVDPNFKTKTCKSKQRSFKQLNVSSSLICGSHCASNADCRSFFFFPSSFRCDGCTLTYDIGSKLANTGEKTLHYTSEEIGSSSMYQFMGCFSTWCSESKCSSDEQINIINNDMDLCWEMCEIGVKRLNNIALEGDNCYCNWFWHGSLQTECDTNCTDRPNQLCGGNDSLALYLHKDYL